MRQELEQQLLSVADDIDWHPSRGVFPSEAVLKLIDHWVILGNYFEEVDDRDIGVEVIREYIDWVHHFSVAKDSESLTREDRNAAQDALEDLKGQMERIVSAVTSRSHPNGR